MVLPSDARSALPSRQVQAVSVLVTMAPAADTRLAPLRAELNGAVPPPPLAPSALPPAPAQDGGGSLPGWALTLIGGAVTAMLAAAVWAADHLHSDPVLHSGALFVHMIALVIGFGAVFTVDWCGLLWLLGRRSLEELAKLGAAVHLPIWLGLFGLVLSGMLLQPDLSAPLTWVKLGLVLMITLNGLHVYVLGERMSRLGADVPRHLLRRASAAAAISQLGWWGATIIGFLNAQH